MTSAERGYRAFDLCVVRTFRSAVSGEPKGSHYVVLENALTVKGTRSVGKPRGVWTKPQARRTLRVSLARSPGLGVNKPTISPMLQTRFEIPVAGSVRLAWYLLCEKPRH